MKKALYLKCLWLHTNVSYLLPVIYKKLTWNLRAKPNNKENIMSGKIIEYCTERIILLKYLKI